MDSFNSGGLERSRSKKSYELSELEKKSDVVEPVKGDSDVMPFEDIPEVEMLPPPNLEEVKP